MKKLNSVELRDRQSVLMKRCKEIVDTCKAEIREMSEEEAAEFQANKEEIESLKAQLEDLKAKLATYEDELPTEEEKADEDEEEIVKEEEIEKVEEDENKVKRNKSNKMNKSIVKEIRSAMENGTNKFKINAATEKRTVQVTGESGVHDSVIETEVTGILEPLYAKSVLSELNVRWFKGLPHGDVQIPKMSAGSCGWIGEVSAANASDNEFTSVLLQPKRLSCYIDVSRQLLAQDTIGVNEAIQRDMINAINDKLQRTIFDASAGSTTRPAGIFYDASIYDCSTFQNLCELESKIEDNNVYGETKYLLSTKAKSDFRCMSKSSKATQLVMENSLIDGTPTITTSSVNAVPGLFAYGDWSALAIGSWGEVEVVVDPYSTAINGTVRLVINCYFDAKVVRPEALVFGKTR